MGTRYYNRCAIGEWCITCGDGMVRYIAMTEDDDTRHKPLNEAAPRHTGSLPSWGSGPRCLVGSQ